MIAETVFQLLRPLADELKATLDYAQRPQTYPLPALVIQTQPVTRDDHAKGRSDNQVGQVTINALTNDYLDTEQLAAAVERRLNGFRGSVLIEAGEVRVVLFDPNTAELNSDHRDGQGDILTHGRSVTLSYRLHEPPGVAGTQTEADQ